MANHSLPRFAKRHYEAIALAMQEAMRVAIMPGDVHCVRMVIDELADTFARDNGQFKRDRFISACVPGANVKARTNGGAR
jgi:hypothetical protein